jgi:hypothetical protein
VPFGEALDQGEELEAPGDGSGQKIQGVIQFCDAYHCSRSTYVPCFTGSTVGRCRIGAGQLESS